MGGGATFGFKKSFFLYLGVHLGPRNSLRDAQSNFKEDFFLVWTKTKFFPRSFETICKRQQRFVKIFDVLGTIKIFKKVEILTRMLRPICAR
jgi:hypothetical protein